MSTKNDLSLTSDHLFKNEPRRWFTRLGLEPVARLHFAACNAWRTRGVCPSWCRVQDYEERGCDELKPLHCFEAHFPSCVRFNSVLSLSDQVSRGYIAVAGAHVVIASMAPLNELIWTILVQPVFRVMDASYYGREESSKTMRQISSWQSPSPYRKGRFQMDFHLGIHTFLASAPFQM